MTWRSDAQIGAAAAGTGAGMLASLIPGVGAAGPLFGGALGEAMAAIFGLGEKPALPDVPPEMKQAAGLQMFGLSQIASLQGLSSRDVARIGQIGSEEMNAETLRANTMSARMTPYDRKRLYDRLIEISRGSKKTAADKIAMLDVGAAAQNAQALITGGAQTANTMASIQNIQFRNQLIYDNYRSKNLEAFTTGMGNALKGIFAGADMMRTSEEELNKSREATKDAAQVMDARVAAAPVVGLPDPGMDARTKADLDALRAGVTEEEKRRARIQLKAADEIEGIDMIPAYLNVG